ncbi:uncharacterized protein CCR75_006048 [Bremia lactucae]|uniref:Uncharacterized protein n=1 Tax=Bremia lactucae TaxID=4779 RepID=A0A976NYJ6_BRELC|nr:hypothetical protein CCR75_006048 [Bremia lactucae]
MFWSAALDLKTQRLPCRSYGSFSRSDVISNSFHIPQSIPEHQPVSQFTSPLPDRRRIEEYIEHPDTVLARARQVTEHTQTALKLLLQASAQTAPKQNIALEMHSFSKTGTFATLAREVELAECTALLKPLHSREVLTTQESRTEQNYWMQELERRRAGLQKSRRRTCTPMSERATTSPLKVGVVMCSVPLVLVIAFVLYMFIFGDASSDVINVVYQPMSIGEFSIRHTTAGLNGLRIVRAIAQERGELHVDKKDFVTASDVLTSLRSPQKEETDER